MAKPDEPLLNITDLFGIAAKELERSIKTPNILNVGEKPYPEQDRFFASQKWGRFISGGNRGGKTDAAVIDAVQMILNRHPWRKRNPDWGSGPLFIRFAVPDVSVGIHLTMVPKFRRWVPENELRGGSWDKAWDSNNYILHFENGSTVDFITYKMDLAKLGGVPRHAIYFDEEPPQFVFNELMMRLVDFDGYWVIMATPTRGMTWTYDLLWEPANDKDNPKHELIDTFVLDPASNPYNQATSEELAKFTIGMDSEEIRIRMFGEFVSRSGLVFPGFKESVHVVEPQMPARNWEFYSSTDFGWNNPTAWLWHAVGPRGQIITFAEHYQDHLNVVEHSAIVKQREAGWGLPGDEITRIGDPAGTQRTGNTGTSYVSEYAMRGLYIGTDTVPRGDGSVQIGIEKMQQYFAPREDSPWGIGRPWWVISQNCRNFIREMKKLRWESYESDNKNYDSNKKEEVHKRDDHAFDSARYFATQRPSLRPIEPKQQDVEHLSYNDFLAKMAEDTDLELAEARAGRSNGWQTEMYEADDAWSSAGW